MASTINNLLTEERELRAALCLETEPERAAGLPASEAGEGPISPPRDILKQRQE